MSKSVQIRDVPEEVHKVLRVRAATERKSLSEYLRTELIKLASRPSVAEVLDRASARGGGVSTDAIVEAVRSGRERGDRLDD